VDIGQALLKCEAEVSMTTTWRLHAMTLGQLECLPHCVPSDFIYSHFIPVIFDRMFTAVSIVSELKCVVCVCWAVFT
jgi:serine/threonine-protein phosphatase 4 regulatory subunit 4